MSAFRSFTIAVPEFRDKPEDLSEWDRKTFLLYLCRNPENHQLPQLPPTRQ